MITMTSISMILRNKLWKKLKPQVIFLVLEIIMLYIFGGKGYKAWNDHTLYSLKTNSSEWVAISINSDSFS